jgi:precorrin-6A/cobalt-precorrin-6A reductase
MATAVAALGPAPRRVVLTIGQKELAPFHAAPQHSYVIRSVDAPAPDSLPPLAEVITARGPFAESDERRLLMENRIEVIVTKNSGGSATAAKLAAARALALPVVMVERPTRPEVETVGTAEEALAWLEHAHRAIAASRRGV